MNFATANCSQSSCSDLVDSSSHTLLRSSRSTIVHTHAANASQTAQFSLNHRHWYSNESKILVGKIPGKNSMCRKMWLHVRAWSMTSILFIPLKCIIVCVNEHRSSTGVKRRMTWKPSFSSGAHFHMIPKVNTLMTCEFHHSHLSLLDYYDTYSAFRFSPLDVNSRESACLTNFLLSGK